MASRLSRLIAVELAALLVKTSPRGYPVALTVLLSKHRCAAQSIEDLFLRYDRPVGVREKTREVAFPLAGGGRRARQDRAQSEEFALLLGGIDLAQTERRRWYRWPVVGEYSSAQIAE